MSNILQRLAGQAMGIQADQAARIRPAASVHAQVPIALPSEVDATPQLTPLRADTAPRSEDSREKGTHSVELAKEHIAVLHSIEAVRARQDSSTPQPKLVTRTESRPVPREDSRQRESIAFPAGTPQPLLDEVEVASQPPAIKPAPQPPPPVNLASSQSRDEPAEVHVHIGRIEVIAAPDSAPPKRNRAAPTRNTLPLADYLARRRPS